LSATRPGLFPCMRRAPRWKQRWAYSLWWVDPKRRTRSNQVPGRHLL
jgi:hypothetical protein